MKTYNKRIAFLISKQHLIPHGGLGSFAKSFTEMCNRLQWKVDLILDQKPTNDFSATVQSLGAGIVCESEGYTYTEHTATYGNSDSANFEKMANFRKSLIKAFNQNSYDMIVCNTQESMSSVHALYLSEYIPVVFYTHQPSMVNRNSDSKDVFLKPYHDLYNAHLNFDDICVGTQSVRNKNNLEKYGAKNVYVLPMPMSERELLESSVWTILKGENVREKVGVLYIGRWEPRKNPEAFLKVMKKCNLPVRIMTNKNGAAKFEAELQNLQITDYIIMTEIYGQEKVDFIKSCKVHFNPSYSENYPFVFFECLGHMHCVVLDTQDWVDNFDPQYYHITDMKNAADLIKKLYEQPVPHANLQYIVSLDNATDQAWVDFLNNFNGKKSTSNKAKINLEQTISHEEFIIKLNRQHLNTEDIVSILGNKHKFNVIYTDNNTYYSKDENFVPEEHESLLEFG